jgi:hypothetical protein
MAHLIPANKLINLKSIIGLRGFLFNIGVPACSLWIRTGNAEAYNRLLPALPRSKEQLRINGRLNFRELLTTAEGVRKVTRWWLRRRILEQFRLAEELIEN